MKAAPKPVSLVACWAEFVGMALFVVFGCGSAMGIAGSGSNDVPAAGGNSTGASTAGETTSVLPGWVLMVALVFGLTITTLAYAIGPYSGGHLNCAVTFGLVLAGQCGVLQGLANLLAQLLGSVLGALILCAIYPQVNDMTHTLASNSVGTTWHWWNALIGEAMGTLLLVFVVLQTACHPKSKATRAQACLAIGLAVFAAHAVLIPIDGCSINPTRSFGPALLSLGRTADRAATVAAQAAMAPDVPMLTTASPNATAAAAAPAAKHSAGNATAPPVVATTAPPSAAVAKIPVVWRDMWIFWVGPLSGAAVAAGLFRAMWALDGGEADEAEEESAMVAAVSSGGNPVLLGRGRQGKEDGKRAAQDEGMDGA